MSNPKNRLALYCSQRTLAPDSQDKDSGIVNDPNDSTREHQQPRYIIDLLARVVRVSLETLRIVAGLPSLNERK